MSEFARLVYLHLLTVLNQDPDAWVNYKPLAQHFRPERRLSWRGGPLHEALGEIVVWCHARGLPALPAVVVRIIDGRPGDGFYVMAFPGVVDEQERRRLWRDEVARVRETVYPALAA
jgi:hypothetical protein